MPRFREYFLKFHNLTFYNFPWHIFHVLERNKSKYANLLIHFCVRWRKTIWVKTFEYVRNIYLPHQPTNEMMWNSFRDCIESLVCLGRRRREEPFILRKLLIDLVVGAKFPYRDRKNESFYYNHLISLVSYACLYLLFIHQWSEF